MSLQPSHCLGVATVWGGYTPTSFTLSLVVPPNCAPAMFPMLYSLFHWCLPGCTPCAVHPQDMPPLSCTAHPMLGCATPWGAAAAPGQETTGQGERVLRHPGDSVPLPFCWPPAIKSLAGCRCAGGGAPVPQALKTGDSCQHKPHPRPPGPLLPLSQQVYFTRSLQVPVSLHAPTSGTWAALRQVGSGTGWSGFVPAKG